MSTKATITTGANSIQIVLENLQANPTSVVQCISGFDFHVSTGQNAGVIASSSGLLRDISNTGTYVDGATPPTGWGLTTNGANLLLNALGFVGPEGLIIGPPNGSNLYAGANGSIAGNGPHNPFIGLTATFNLTVAGVTTASTIDAATFRFNTSPGNNVPGEIVPEPATLALLPAALMLCARRRKA